MQFDCCNFILAGLSYNTFRPPQRVQNAAMHLIFDLKPCDHIGPGLIQLHWLLIQYCITCKLCTLMFAIHTQQSPVYMVNLVSTASSWSPRYDHRPSDLLDYVKPHLSSKLGELVFSYAGFTAWDALPTYYSVSINLARFGTCSKNSLVSNCFLTFTPRQLFLPF
jgi:hypothetical protein